MGKRLGPWGTSIMTNSRTLKRVLAAGVVGLALAAGQSGARAADLPSRVVAPVVPVLPVPDYNWTGFYVGISGGGDFPDNNFTTTSLATGFAVDPTTNTAALSDARARVGGFVGFNYQINQLVIGVEGDGAYDFGNRKSTNGIPGEAFVTPPNVDSISVNSRYDASARGRLGVVLLPGLLVYATGGAAFRDASISASCPGNGVNSFCSRSEFQTYSGTRTGYTIGGGVEAVVFRNVTARAEYRYSDFGTKTYSFFGAPNDAAGDFFAGQSKLTASTFTVGLAYKFDFAQPLAPVVARY